MVSLFDKERSMMTEQQIHDLSISSNPQHWLAAFNMRAIQCKEGEFTIRGLFNELVMMGPLPWGDWEYRDKLPDCYDCMVWNILNDNGLILKMRKEALRDFHREELPWDSEEKQTNKHSDGDKGYVLALLSQFLKLDPPIHHLNK